MAELSAAEQKLADAEAAAKLKEEEAAKAAKEEAEKTGLSEQDIIKAVEKARSEEKDKLYPQIDALKESLKDIQDALRTEREEKENIKRQAEEKAEADRIAKLSESDKTTEALRRIEEQLTAERRAREAVEQRLADQARKAELAKYRESAIAAAGDSIKFFESLITGNSEAEIDAAINKAKASATELEKKIKEETGASVRRSMPKSEIPDTAALEEQELSEQLQAVDTDKYKKDPAYRAKIQAEVARAYESTGRI